MAIQEGFMLVQSELFNIMQQHCENCPGFDISLQTLSNGRVVTPTESPSNSKKQIALKSTGLSQNTSVTEATRSRAPSQPSGTGPSPQSDVKSPQSGTRSSVLSAAAQSRPLSNPGKIKKVKKSKTTQAFDRFIRNAPNGRWRERQLELGLNTAEEYEHVIQCFPRRTHIVSKSECRQELKESDSELIVVGKKIAVLTKSSLEDVNHQRSLAYFQVLILLSYCEFLRQKGVSDQAIDELIQTVTNIRERDRKMLLGTIQWIHRLIVELVNKGWTLHRATELFFINALSISDLVWIRSEETFKSILEYLSADIFVKCKYDDSLTPNYTIPGLIASLFDSLESTNQISLIELYDVLGYNLPDLPSSVEGIYKVHPAKSALGWLGSPGFENLTPISFVLVGNRNCPHHEETEKSLFSLIYAIRAIPKFMLEQAVSPQQRWDESGAEYQTSPRRAGLDPYLKDLFLDSSKMWQVLKHLISAAAVRVERSDNIEIYICSSSPAECLHGQKISYWIEQALCLFCYIFPRNPTALPISEREALLAVLENLLCRYTETGLELPSSDEVIEILLAASKVGPLARRCLVLSLVDPLRKRTVNAHLQAEAVYQRSVVLRLKGDIASSNQLLHEFLNHSDMITRLKSQPILGLLHLSRATNYAYNFDFLSANKEAKTWIPTQSDDTEKQLDVVWSQIHSAGRILRGQGHFDIACLFFERCLQMESLHQSKRLLALSHLADTYIEVDYLRRCDVQSTYVGDLLEKAEKLIRPEIEHLRSNAPRCKGFRRLLLSLSEIEIRRSRFDRAEHLLMEVSSIYGKLVDPDIVDRLGHVRAFIALARISPLSQAETRWTNALNLGRRYNPLEEEVFTVAFIHLFICAIRLKHSDLEGGKAAFDYAADIYRTKPSQFLIPGAGTYLFHDVQYRIYSLAGWKLPRHESYN